MTNKYSIITFGCQMNHSDSERVAAILESMGYMPAKQDEISEIYVINTCSVRQKAEDKVFGLGKQFEEIKKTNNKVKVILTGCIVKRDNRQKEQNRLKYMRRYKNELRQKMPWVDLFVEINEIHKLPELLGISSPINVSEYLSIQPKYNSSFQAYVPISTGCNKFCTFCIVPFTRGEEIYRCYHEIYEEVLNLVKLNYKEITLLGQNVNSWRSDVTGHLKVPVPKFRDQKYIQNSYLDFTDLMESLANIEGDFWLRFTSSHPYDINPRLIDVVAKYPNIAKQIHFALQSGSDTVLKRMNRYYTVAEFKEKVKMIREKIPGVAITTDIIVGFCGESEEEFNQTVEVCRELKFDQIYISEYSERKGTIAAKFYKDDVPREIKKQRKQILNEILKQGLIENNSKLIDTVQKTLIEKIMHKNDSKFIIGKNTQGKQVIASVPNKINLSIGTFTNVKITKVKDFVLEGEIV